MAKLKMMKVRIVALREDRKALLERLQRLGTVEPEYLPESEQLDSPDTSQEQSRFEEIIRRINSTLEVLERYSPKKSSLLDSFKPRPDIEPEDYEGIVAERDETLRLCDEIASRQKSIDELNAENIRLQTRIDALEPWLALDMPMRFTGTARTTAMVGCLPGQHSEQDIRESLAYRCPDVEALHIETVGESSENTCVFVLCMKEETQEIDAALRSIGFARPTEMSKKAPPECSAELGGRITQREKRIETLRSEIIMMADSRQRIEYLLDYYTMRLDKYRAIAQLGAAGRTFIMEGWVPERNYERLREVCSEMGAYCETIEPSPKDDPPVALKNGWITEAGEPVLAMYSLPSKRDIDPTSVMTIFYYILFGIMLGDAAYGIIMVIATLFVLLKLKPEPQQARNVKLFMFSGLSATVWGIVFGSVFGDLPNVIAHTFMGVPDNVSVLKPLWFDPIADPMKMMIFAIAIGVVHVLTGLVMGIITAVKNRDAGAAVFDYGAWLFMLVAGIAWGLIAVLGIAVPDVANYALLAIIGISVVLVLLMNARGTKSVGKRLLKGAYALYGVTGYLSDFMSYSRLLALALATGVISQVFNKMASMVGGGLSGSGAVGTVIGGILMVVICIIGHAFNLGISLIGCYVHTNRLQYIEFFGKFFEGGGREYKPLTANTKFFKFKEEN